MRSVFHKGAGKAGGAIKIKIHKLTHKSIKPYGIIIDSSCVDDDGQRNCFGILLKEKSNGWRIDCLVAREKIIRRLESHPDSLETFEPVKGKSVIVLAACDSPEKVTVFLLDKPVVIKKRVWHDAAPLSEIS